MKSTFQLLAAVILLGVTLVNAIPSAPSAPATNPSANTPQKRQASCPSDENPSLCQLSYCQQNPGSCTTEEIQSYAQTAYAETCDNDSTTPTCTALEACIQNADMCTPSQ
ncbi:hypothetical protein BDQ17DRAFT_756450 [Cyathus striatus]|nr:hypothetical protein BDQ17DRAFT_536591 [Cyathus striatus]KAF8999282.1 hypothetical protein BDQ17DRAFT_756450 [Cyathus striatus]